MVCVGYGMTTPRTLASKLTVIVYGLLGCSGCILFFNLFLERIITVLALMLRAIRRRRKANDPDTAAAGTGGANPRRGSRSVYSATRYCVGATELVSAPSDKQACLCQTRVISPLFYHVFILNQQSKTD